LFLAAAALLGPSNPAHAAPGDNLALGKPVTMSGGDPADPTQQGANCTDGNTGGNYPTNTICRTIGAQTGANREWIEVDLGQDYVINRVRLSNRTDGTNGDFARWIVITTRPSSLTGVTSDPQSTLDPAVNPSAPFVNKIAYATGNTTGTSYGTAQAAAWTTLDLQVGTHIARYVRIYSMKPAPTSLNLAEIAVIEGPPPIRTIANPSFEQPAVAANSVTQVSETLVPGWSTTEPVAVPTAGASFVNGGDIEMWGTGFGGVASDNGGQFVELNAYSNGALSPAPLCIYPGETFTWRTSHRARGTPPQVDVAKLRINGQDVATFSDATNQAGTHTCTPAAGFNCTAQAGSPTATGWGRWQGTWTSALALPTAMTFEFGAIQAAGPGSGNFLDNVSITGLSAAVEFSNATATGPETTPTANLPMLLINGPVTAAQTIQLDIVGGTATRGVDYTTNPVTGSIVITIPVGTYDGTAATGISLAPYIQILTDAVAEGAETIVLQLSNASSGLSIAGASGCRAGIATSTYTITDVVDPILTVTKTATPNPFAIAQPASYAIAVQNTGYGPTTANIVVTDTLPAGITYVSAVGTNWSCTGTTTLTCTFTGTLAVGDTATLTLNVNVTGAALNGDNSATASGGGDATCPAAAHCTGSVTVPIDTAYVCSPSTIFITQNTPAQLFSETYGSGAAVFNPIGPASAWNYNSAAYRSADDFIYAVSAALDAAHPVNHLLRVDPATGSVADLGAITGLPASGVNSGAFDGSDNYYVGFNTATSIYRINLTTRVATAVALAPVAQLIVSDWTFASGYFWGVTNGAQTITRVNPANGAIARFAATMLPTASGYGAAWTFGNGNLGFGNNDTGAIYQVRVATPAGTPTFTLVSSSPGPIPSIANDGTSCVSPPADLAITKTGTASSSAGGALSWTLTVTNNGAGVSSGFTVVDTVPAGVTAIASPTAGCTVTGSTVTCVEGALAVGGTFTITVTGNAPNPFSAAITNTATVTGNETDSVAANNTATATVTPLNPILTVSKTATPNPFVIGSPASYAITVQNTGSGPTTANTVVTDTLPAGITYVSAAGSNWTCTGTTTLTCTYTGTLAAGASTVLTLNVNVTATAVNGNNSATARGGGDTTCPATGAAAAHCTGTVAVPINTAYICSPSTIYVAQSTPTQLNAETYGSGGAVFNPIGPPSAWSYNAIGYRASDNFIYAISGALDAAHPINHLLRIDPGNGGVADLGVIAGMPAAGVNNGSFDAAGNYYVASGSDTAIYRVNLTTLVATAINLTPSQALGIADFAPASGYLWNITTSSSPPTMTRVNPANGAIARFAIPVMPIVTATGAAWTFGNGNLGFSDNTTGNVYQIRVTNPTTTPTFALVSQSPGPTSGQNDGTSCVTPPIDLAIAKTGPASAGPGGAISWTLTVTNNGPAASSGYTVVDTVPAGVTNIASPTPGCTVAGSTVTCVGGTLLVGATFSFTVTGNAPNPFTAAITNTATVAGNETDPVAANNTATQTVTPPPPTPPTLIKYFNTDPASNPPPVQPPPIRRGGTALLTFVLNNTQLASGSQSGLGFTDTLPAGLVLAGGTTPPSALVGTNTCGGTLTAQSGTAVITLAGGTVAANAQCSFTVRVTTAP
jgi:uncharacterized repeat protein (TIGR01451 family)